MPRLVDPRDVACLTPGNIMMIYYSILCVYLLVYKVWLQLHLYVHSVPLNKCYKFSKIFQLVRTINNKLVKDVMPKSGFMILKSLDLIVDREWCMFSE